MTTRHGFIAAAIALSAAFGTAHAANTQFKFTATVTATDGSLSGVGVGTTFTGGFNYDPSTAPDSSSTSIASYSLGSGSQITATIGAHQILGENLHGDVFDNLGGNVEDGVSLFGGYSLFVDGTTYSDGVFGFNLTTQPGNTGVLSGTQLPSSFDVAAFDGHSSLTYGVLQRNGGQNGQILSFKVDSITASVPEPSSMLLIGTGLLGLGMASRRQAKA